MKTFFCTVILVFLFTANAYCSEALALMLPPVVLVDGEIQNEVQPKSIEVDFKIIEIGKTIINKCVEILGE